MSRTEKVESPQRSGRALAINPLDEPVIEHFYKPMGGSPVRVPGPPPAQASGTRLSPDITQPQLAGGEGVATFEGAAPVAKPATLGDLLDMTLGL